MRRFNMPNKPRDAERRYLYDRLEERANALRYTDIKLKVTTEVRAAQKLIAQHNRAENRLNNIRRNRLTKAFTKAQEIVLFGKVEQALKTVKAFERIKFR